MNEIIAHLQASYGRRWLNIVLRLSDVGQLLAQSEIPDAFDFVKAYCTASMLVQHWVFRLIEDEAIRKKFDSIISVAHLLKEFDLFEAENFTVVIVHAEPKFLSATIFHLLQAGILTKENRALAASCNCPHHLSAALCRLKGADILTEDNFRKLLEHASLLSTQVMENFWFRIPSHLITQQSFSRLIRASEANNPLEAIQQAIQGIERTINGSQSTHTASVHRSVSESARRLKASYGQNLVLETAIQCIKADIDALPNDTLPHQAAKRAILHLTQNYNFFEDPASGISIFELLGLFYLAIHDDKKRSSSLDDAKSLLIEALYEIQRGGNLDEQGLDQGDLDAFICMPGAFNKLIEKLCGIHADVSLVFVTPELATCKFPYIVKAIAMAYLKKQDAALLDTIKADNGVIASIWDAIKLDVAQALWDEFEEAFSNNRADNRFEALMDTGVDVALSPAELLEIKRTFPASVTSISLLRTDEVSFNTPDMSMRLQNGF